jgi:hypothetical protein
MPGEARIPADPAHTRCRTPPTVRKPRSADNELGVVDARADTRYRLQYESRQTNRIHNCL